MAVIDHEGASREEAISSPWATASIGANPDAVIEEFQLGLTINLIATPRADFVTCHSDEFLPSVVERHRETIFDHLPVIETGVGADHRTARGRLFPGDAGRTRCRSGEDASAVRGEPHRG
jgi:hypothetical protein